MTEVWEQDAWELADAVRRGDQRSTELLDVFVERIEKLNPELNAFCYLDLEGAREAPEEAEARLAQVEAVAAGVDQGQAAGVGGRQGGAQDPEALRQALIRQERRAAPGWPSFSS